MFWLPPLRSPRTSPCWRCFGEPSSGGGSATSSGYGRLGLRHRGEHNSYREGEHPRLHGAQRCRTGTPFFGKDEFTYDPKGDLYACPWGELLAPRTRNVARSLISYRAKAGTCNACSLRSDCTTSKTGRQILLHFDEKYVDRVKGYRGTFLYEKALRKRRVWVEPLFAEAKDWHGMRRFRLRGLEKVNIEALLIASGQNVKRLLTFEGRKPKKTAQAAALRPPVTTGHEISRTQEHRSSRSWKPTRTFSTRWQAKDEHSIAEHQRLSNA